jgi:hypothetical protein
MNAIRRILILSVLTTATNDGTTYAMAETNATTRTTSDTIDRGYLSYQPRISVMTLTSYGWTTESAKSAVLTC